MLVSAIQNQPVNSVKNLQAKKISQVSVGKDLKFDSFSNNNLQKVSFKGTKSESGALVGGLLGLGAALVVAVTAPVSIPVLIATGLVAPIGGALAGTAVGAKKDQEGGN